MKDRYEGTHLPEEVSDARLMATSLGIIAGIGGAVFWGGAILVDGGAEPAVDGANVTGLNESYDAGSDFERENFFASLVIGGVAFTSAIDIRRKNLL